MRAVQSTAASAPSIPLADGDPGTRQTVDLVRALVARGVTSPRVRDLAASLVRHLPAYHDQAELLAIFQFVQQQVRFTRDMAAVWESGRGWCGKETLHTAEWILDHRIGDCDDFVILLASLLGTIGYSTRAVTIKADPTDPESYSHIYLEAEVPQGSGNWIALDAARPGAAFGRQPEYSWQTERHELTGGGPQIGSFKRRRGLLNGTRRPAAVFLRARSFPRFGRRGLGQSSDLSTILAAAPAIEQGAASIVSASNLPGYPPIGLPYSPYVGVPGQGYPASTVSLSTGGSTLTWIVGGVVAIAALAFVLRR